MTSLVDEQTTSDFQDIQKKVIQHLKTYTFFIFYQKQQLLEEQSISLQKLAFKLKEQKNYYHEKYGDNVKNIQLNFCDMENQYEVDNSLIDLKISCQENKTKLVFFSEESTLLNIALKARLYNINISNVPFCVYTNGIQSDLSKFLGWGSSLFNLSSVNQIQPNVRKWVQSPTQKIDMWSIQIKVDENNGLIHKVGEGKIIQNLSKSKTHHQYFLSSFSLGYHPQLMTDFDLKKKKNNSIFNKIKYSFKGMKMFCCVGSPSMKSSTGIVKMDFVDDKGQHEMLKQFRDYEGDSQVDIVESKKIKNRRKILSIAGCNIDRFNGQKLGDKNSRMNDSKLELMTFSSLNEFKKISSIGGELTIKLSTQNVVFLQVNDSCYRLQRPLSLIIKQHSKMKVFINKQTLQC